MPIYEYECKECGEVFEVMQSFSDPPIKKCKVCKKGKVQKLISLSSFQLTGSGWYSTDYVKGPGIPPKAADQSNPALANDSKSDGKGKTTDGSSTLNSIKKETKKAKSNSKNK